MKYCIAKGDMVVDGPKFKNQIRKTNPGERYVKTIVKSDPDRNELIDYKYGPKFINIKNGKAVFEFLYRDKTLSESISTAIDIVYRKRISVESYGIMFDGENFAVTDKNKSRLMGIWIACQIDPSREIDMKVKKGNHKKVGKSHIDTLSEAVANHTQNCYSREAILSGIIQACESPGDVKAVIDDEIDIGWPES